MTGWRYRAFGLHIESTFALPGVRALAHQGRPDIALRLAEPGEAARHFSGAGGGPPLWETVFSDGRPFRIESGRFGDHLFTYGDRARFLLAMPAGTLICEPTDRDDPAWQRQLLDTVLLSVAYQRGFELLHASAVETPDGVVAVAAATGGGKTSIAAELLRRGGRLFADDIVALGRHGQKVVAHPAPPVMNLAHEQPGADELGERLASFDNEHEDWISVHAASHAPAPLAAIFLLDRRAEVDTTVERLASNPLHLLPHSVGFRHRSQRRRSRFEMFSDVAATTPIVRLRADAAAPPTLLVDAILRAMAAGRQAGLARGHA